MRFGQLFVFAGRFAFAQLQTFKIDVLSAGQAYVSATGPPTATAKRHRGRYSQRVSDVLLETDQNVPRFAVDKRVTTADPVSVVGFLDTTDVEMGKDSVDRFETRFALLLCEQTQGRTYGIDKRREHHTGVAFGEELLPDRRQGYNMRDRGLCRAVIVFDSGRQLLHYTQT